MPVHNFQALQGDLEFFEIESKALQGNLLGDPARRRVGVYLPAGWKGTRDSFPLLVYLASYTGSGLRKLGWEPYRENIPQRLDRLSAEGRLGPLVLAFPDCFTSLGGNQYVDTPVLGRWEEFLLRELVPELEDRYPVGAGPAGRGVLGFSSGGYGALVQALRHGSHWAAAACHSADLGFDNLFRREFPKVATALARCEGGIEGFVRRFREAPKVKGSDLQVMMMLAMAASYDPDPSQYLGIRLPFDLKTCRLDPERWQRWLAHDPLELVRRPDCRERLRRLELLYLDCGSFDQYHSQYGARELVGLLEAAEIPHFYEEFPDDHSSVEYRLDVSLPMLYRALVPDWQ